MLKRTSLNMPMASAGIIGLGSNMELSGRKMDPKSFLVGTIILIFIIKVAGYFVQ